MADFGFDDSKSFQDNCAAFLQAVESVDQELAAILKANWDKLEKIVHEGQRDSKSRTQFNDAVAEALDAQIEKTFEVDS